MDTKSPKDTRGVFSRWGLHTHGGCDDFLFGAFRYIYLSSAEKSVLLLIYCTAFNSHNICNNFIFLTDFRVLFEVKKNKSVPRIWQSFWNVIRLPKFQVLILRSDNSLSCIKNLHSGLAGICILNTYSFGYVVTGKKGTIIFLGILNSPNYDLKLCLLQLCNKIVNYFKAFGLRSHFSLFFVLPSVLLETYLSTLKKAFDSFRDVECLQCLLIAINFHMTWH